MEINDNQRQQIRQFVLIPPLNFNAIQAVTNGGPCANWVRGVIESATGCQIQNSSHVFAENINCINQGIIIPDIKTFQELVNDGDILYVVNISTGNTTHYMLKCDVEIDGIRCSCLGINGGLNLDSVDYHGVLASRITEDCFAQDGSFIYDRLSGKHLLYLVAYEL